MRYTPWTSHLNPLILSTPIKRLHRSPFHCSWFLLGHSAHSNQILYPHFEKTLVNRDKSPGQTHLMINIKTKARHPERSEGSSCKSHRFFWMEILRFAQDDGWLFKYLRHVFALGGSAIQSTDVYITSKRSLVLA